VKSAVIRQVKSMAMSCDRVGNLLLAKFSAQGANDTLVIIPASIVFFLIKHLPVNQDPHLQPPPPVPRSPSGIGTARTCRAPLRQCKVLPGKISMTFTLDRKPDLTWCWIAATSN
jgi:hypothetical protein